MRESPAEAALAREEWSEIGGEANPLALRAMFSMFGVITLTGVVLNDSKLIAISL